MIYYYLISENIAEHTYVSRIAFLIPKSILIMSVTKPSLAKALSNGSTNSTTSLINAIPRVVRCPASRSIMRTKAETENMKLGEQRIKDKVEHKANTQANYVDHPYVNFSNYVDHPH